MSRSVRASFFKGLFNLPAKFQKKAIVIFFLCSVECRFTICKYFFLDLITVVCTAPVYAVHSQSNTSIVISIKAQVILTFLPPYCLYFWALFSAFPWKACGFQDFIWKSTKSISLSFSLSSVFSLESCFTVLFFQNNSENEILCGIYAAFHSFRTTSP